MKHQFRLLENKNRVKYTMTLEIIITCISFLLCLPPIAIAYQARSTFGAIHLICIVIFIQSLHLLNLLSNEVVVNKFGFVNYIASNAVWVIYSWIFCFGLVLGRNIFADRKLFDIAVTTRDGWLIAAFLSWIGFKVYLVLIYGVNALSTYRSLNGVEGLNFKFAWWETGIENYLASFAVGACVVYLVKVISIPDYWKKLQVSLPLFAFSLPYLVTLESNIGTRRFILLMAIIGTMILWSREKTILDKLSPKQLLRYSLLGFIVLLFSFYYQSVRNNYLVPEIANKLTSSNRAKIFQGIALSFIPNIPNIPNSSNIPKVISKPAFLRSGPFELTQEMVNILIEHKFRILKGEITAASFSTAIPRVIAGEGKSVRRTDDIIAERFSLWPNGKYLIVDLPTSLPVVFLADFGFLGVLIAPLAMLFGFFVLNVIAQSKVLNVAPWHMIWISTLFEFSMGVEYDLTGLLANIRNVLIVCPLVFLAWMIGKYLVSQKRVA